MSFSSCHLEHSLVLSQATLPNSQSCTPLAMFWHFLRNYLLKSSQNWFSYRVQEAVREHGWQREKSDEYIVYWSPPWNSFCRSGSSQQDSSDFVFGGTNSCLHLVRRYLHPIRQKLHQVLSKRMLGKNKEARLSIDSLTPGYLTISEWYIELTGS